MHAFQSNNNAHHTPKVRHAWCLLAGQGLGTYIWIDSKKKLERWRHALPIKLETRGDMLPIKLETRGDTHSQYIKLESREDMDCQSTCRALDSPCNNTRVFLGSRTLHGITARPAPLFSRTTYLPLPESHPRIEPLLPFKSCLLRPTNTTPSTSCTRLICLRANSWPPSSRTM